jgi:hypothetical protein
MLLNQNMTGAYLASSTALLLLGFALLAHLSHHEKPWKTSQ